MSSSLGRKSAGSAIALCLAFGLAGCESTADIQRKPALANDVIGKSMTICNMQDDPLKDKKPYQERLRDVLMDTKSSTLDFLLQHRITVCLDKRLENQKNGFLGTDIEGVYYPDQKIITLWDNGANDKKASMFQWSAADRGPKYLNSFEDSFGRWFSNYNAPEDVKEPMMAYYYTTTTSCGTGCTTTTEHFDWDRMSTFRKPNAIDNRPVLRLAPLSKYPGL